MALSDRTVGMSLRTRAEPIYNSPHGEFHRDRPARCDPGRSSGTRRHLAGRCGGLPYGPSRSEWLREDNAHSLYRRCPEDHRGIGAGARFAGGIEGASFARGIRHARPLRLSRPHRPRESPVLRGGARRRTEPDRSGPRGRLAFRPSRVAGRQSFWWSAVARLTRDGIARRSSSSSSWTSRPPAWTPCFARISGPSSRGWRRRA